MPEEMLRTVRLRDIACKKWTPLDVVVPRTKFFKALLELILFNVRHKAERAHVDAADGHGIRRIPAADAKKRAVATEAERKIRRLMLDVVHAAVLHAKLRRTHMRQENTRLTRGKERTNPP